MRRLLAAVFVLGWMGIAGAATFGGTATYPNDVFTPLPYDRGVVERAHTDQLRAELKAVQEALGPDLGNLSIPAVTGSAGSLAVFSGLNEVTGVPEITWFDNSLNILGNAMVLGDVFASGEISATSAKLSTTSVVGDCYRATDAFGRGAFSACGAGGGTECSSASCNLNVSTTINGFNICRANGTGCPAETQCVGASCNLNAGTTIASQAICRANGTNCPGGLVPGGSATELQFKNGGALGGASVYYDSTRRLVTFRTDPSVHAGPIVATTRYQLVQECTGSGAPYACCTGPKTGSCPTGGMIGFRAWTDRMWLANGSLQVDQGSYPWRARTKALWGDRVTPWPEPNGRRYVVDTEGAVDSSSPPYASASKPGGWPRRRMSYTSYKAGERVWPGRVALSTRRYRVQADCVSGSAAVSALTWCTTNGCTVTDNTCTYVCDDDACADNSALVQDVVDGAAKWDDAGQDGSFPTLLYMGQGDEAGGADPTTFMPLSDRVLVTTNSDNASYAVIADRGNVAWPWITSSNTDRNRNQRPWRALTASPSPRGNRPSVNFGGADNTAVQGFAVWQMLNPDATNHCNNPEGELDAVVDGAGTWSAGCHFFCYAWECGSGMVQRTECSRYKILYTNGSQGIRLTLREGYPTAARRAVVYHQAGNGASQAACDAIGSRPREVYRSAFIEKPATTITLATNPITGESESFEPANFTHIPVWFMGHPAGPTQWAPSTTYAGSIGTFLKVLPRTIAAGGAGRNGWYYALVGTCANNTAIGGSTCAQADMDWMNFSCRSGTTDPTWPTGAGDYFVDGQDDANRDCVWKAMGPAVQNAWYGNTQLGNPAWPMHEFRAYPSNVGLSGISNLGMQYDIPTDTPSTTCSADTIGHYYFDKSEKGRCECTDTTGTARWCKLRGGLCGDATSCNATTTSTSTSTTTTTVSTSTSSSSSSTSTSTSSTSTSTAP